MKINTEWLGKEFGIKIPVEKLLKILTNLGFEVESVTQFQDFSVLELNVTPNRGDCMSHAGIARELLAFLGKKFQQKKLLLKESDEKITKYARVNVLDGELCLRYTARMLRNVKIDKSPEWLVRRLESVGIRSINNVVDVTNYILMELGHPLHAFDYDKIKGGKIIVRRAEDGEKIVTLDGVERNLGSENLVIADEEKPVALAGVMGGANTEVTDSTENVLLEAAVFLPESIQRTSKKLKLETESSIRFSRGVDYEGTVYAIDRAALMIQELADGEILSGRINIARRRKKATPVKFTLDDLNTFLGIEIDEKMVKRILSSLNFRLSKRNKTIIAVPPTYRNDIKYPADIYEEVARHYGYDRIPLKIPADKLFTTPEIKKDVLKIIKMKMESAGFNEVITYSFINPDHDKKLLLDNQSETIYLLNPLSQERSVMRKILLPGLLEVAEYNINHGNKNLKIYECGRVFHFVNNSFIETQHLGGLVAGFIENEWYSKPRFCDFFDIKGIIDELFRISGLNFKTSNTTEPFLVPGTSADIICDGRKIGFAGELLPTVREKFSIDTPCLVFELDINDIININIQSPVFKQLPRLLPLEKDISVIVDRNVPGISLIESVKKASPLIQKVKIFDVYEGGNIPQGKKSIGLKLKLQPSERNLTDEEIDNIILSAVNLLKNEFNAELRGNIYDKSRNS